LKKFSSIFLLLFFCIPSWFAQNIDCDAIEPFFTKKEIQINQLNLYDPDYIPLHYLVVQDILHELYQYKNDVLLHFSECETVTFIDLVSIYEKVINSAQQKRDSLFLLHEMVYVLFYQKALDEYQFHNEEEGKYFLDRSLQYNPVFPDAILFKLNKLLEKDRFQECLSLLNMLYYETALNLEQEKQAIVFTDQFYDKLYKTGDSLIKMEHAAEALKLFEILEIFCQNLPAEYCNDDYYHGILKSKTGIYDSYLAIAKVAEWRENSQIADRFYQYAQEYLDNNPHLKTYEPRPETLIAESRKQKAESGEREKAESRRQNAESREQNAEDRNMIVEKSNEEQLVAAETSVEELEKTKLVLSPKEIKEKYDDLVLQALAFCIKEDFSASYEKFTEAKKLEDCECFGTDFRVDLMINELSKIGIK
jgi:hypothetical protein